MNFWWNLRIRHRTASSPPSGVTGGSVANPSCHGVNLWIACHLTDCLIVNKTQLNLIMSIYVIPSSGFTFMTQCWCKRTAVLCVRALNVHIDHTHIVFQCGCLLGRMTVVMSCWFCLHAVRLLLWLRVQLVQDRTAWTSAADTVSRLRQDQDGSLMTWALCFDLNLCPLVAFFSRGLLVSFSHCLFIVFIASSQYNSLNDTFSPQVFWIQWGGTSPINEKVYLSSSVLRCPELPAFICPHMSRSTSICPDSWDQFWHFGSPFGISTPWLCHYNYLRRKSSLKFSSEKKCSFCGYLK